MEACGLPVCDLFVGEEGVKLFKNGAAADDIKQGDIGNCGLIAGIAAMAENQVQLQTDVFITKEYKPEQPVLIKLYDRVERRFRTLAVPDMFPIRMDEKDGCTPAFACPNTPGEAWVLFLEKAFAMLYKNYKLLEENHPYIALQSLTGCDQVDVLARAVDVRNGVDVPPTFYALRPTQTPTTHDKGELQQLWVPRGVQHRRSSSSSSGDGSSRGAEEYWEDCGEEGEEEVQVDQDELWEVLKKCFSQKALMCCATQDLPEDEPLCEFQGLMPSHVYTLQRVVEVRVGEDKVRLLRLRNPHGKWEWQGTFSDADLKERWTDVVKTLTRRGYWASHKDDGAFYMSLDDFTMYFCYIAICNQESQKFSVDPPGCYVKHDPPGCLPNDTHFRAALRSNVSLGGALRFARGRTGGGLAGSLNPSGGLGAQNPTLSKGLGLGVGEGTGAAPAAATADGNGIEGSGSSSSTGRGNGADASCGTGAKGPDAGVALEGRFRAPPREQGLAGLNPKALNPWQPAAGAPPAAQCSADALELGSISLGHHSGYSTSYGSHPEPAAVAAVAAGAQGQQQQYNGQAYTQACEGLAANPSGAGVYQHYQHQQLDHATYHLGWASSSVTSVTMATSYTVTATPASSDTSAMAGIGYNPAAAAALEGGWYHGQSSPTAAAAAAAAGGAGGAGGTPGFCGYGGHYTCSSSGSRDSFPFFPGGPPSGPPDPSFGCLLPHGEPSLATAPTSCALAMNGSSVLTPEPSSSSCSMGQNGSSCYNGRYAAAAGEWQGVGQEGNWQQQHYQHHFQQGGWQHPQQQQQQQGEQWQQQQQHEEQWQQQQQPPQRGVPGKKLEEEAEQGDQGGQQPQQQQQQQGGLQQQQHAGTTAMDWCIQGQQGSGAVRSYPDQPQNKTPHANDAAASATAAAADGIDVDENTVEAWGRQARLEGSMVDGRRFMTERTLSRLVKPVPSLLRRSPLIAPALSLGGGLLPSSGSIQYKNVCPFKIRRASIRRAMVEYPETLESAAARLEMSHMLPLLEELNPRVLNPKRDLRFTNTEYLLVPPAFIVRRQKELKGVRYCLIIKGECLREVMLRQGLDAQDLSLRVRVQQLNPGFSGVEERLQAGGEFQYVLMPC